MPTTLEVFRWNGTIEDLKQYKSGGYHPLHLGDLLQSRYRILHKLGYGSFATVWLAEDQKANNRGVALKVTIAETSGVSHERVVLQALTQGPGGKRNQGATSTHVLDLLDSFSIKGPNGNHDVLVTDVLVPARVARGLRKLNPKRTAYDVVNGIAWLHEQGITHGDIHMDNVAFHVPKVVSTTGSEWLDRLEDPQSIIVFPRDPALINSPGLPKYAVEAVDMEDGLSSILQDVRSEDMSGLIMDLGSACRSSDPPQVPCTPLELRPPETFLKAPNSKTPVETYATRQGDIWSLGCTIYQLVAGSSIFNHIGNEPALLEQMLERVGPLPEGWSPTFNLSASASKTGKDSEKWLEVQFKNDTAFATLLRSIFQYDPSKRPTAKEILAHAWFDEVRKK